jgi:hypothetical protein
MTLRIFSNGGGVQSIAALVLSAKAKAARAGDIEAAAFLLDVTHHKFSLATLLEVLDFDTHLFCNVGDDSEHPASLRYVREVAIPYAEQHGIRFEILQKTWKRGPNKGQPDSILSNMMRPDKAGIFIPLRMPAAGGAPGPRSCTADFKIDVIEQWVRAHGATKRGRAIVGLGISLDEFERMKTDSGEGLQQAEYPLITLRITRDQCIAIILRAGLPVPPKSSCFFCPFHRPSVWMRMRVEEPELFEQAAQVEDEINRRRAARGQGPGYLTRFGIPLRQAIGEQSMMQFEDEYSDACESGYCMT